MDISPEISLEPGSLADKIFGVVYGHALGDAVGLITEFKFKRDKPTINFPYEEPVRDFPVCDWTDDTDHLILVMQSMIDNQFRLNNTDIAERLKNWVSTGFKELGDTVGLGLGGTMNMVINHAKFLENPNEAAAEIWNNSGKKLASNGSLMRTSIVGTMPNFNAVEFWAAELSKITHTDPRCVSACVLQSSLVHGIVYRTVTTPENIDALLQASVNAARKYITAEAEPVIFGDPTFKTRDEELSHWMQLAYTKCIGDLRLDDMVKIGYVFKCLGCSIYALQVIKYALKNNRTPSFRKFILKLASECGDADTNCAVAGAVMGSYLGYSNLPQDWINALPNRGWLNNIVVNYINALTRGTPIPQKQANATDQNDVPEQLP